MIDLSFIQRINNTYNFFKFYVLLIFIMNYSSHLILPMMEYYIILLYFGMGSSKVHIPHLAVQI
jgi:hypothetical protein